MTIHGYTAKHLSRSFLIACSMAVVILAGEAASSPSSAQKAQFERTKPHVNVGAVEQVDNNKIGAKNPARHDTGNLSIDGVQNPPSPGPATVILKHHRRSVHKRIKPPTLRRRLSIRSRRR